MGAATVVVPRIAGSVAYDPTAIAVTGGTVVGTNAPYSAVKSGLTFVHGPTGTMANNGAVTFGTALPAIYANCFILMPAGSIAAGVPAADTWLFAQMTSTTVGTFFNNTYSSGPPAIPASPTAFTTTGPGAFTGSITTADGPNVTIAAGALGANGQLRITSDFAFNTTGTNKLIMVKVAGTPFLNQTSSSDGNLGMTTWFENKGVTNRNRGFAVGAAVNTATVRGTVATYTSIDTTASLALIHSLGKATATDVTVLERFNAEVFFGA